MAEKARSFMSSLFRSQNDQHSLARMLEVLQAPSTDAAQSSSNTEGWDLGGTVRAQPKEDWVTQRGSLTPRGRSPRPSAPKQGEGLITTAGPLSMSI